MTEMNNRPVTARAADMADAGGGAVTAGSEAMETAAQRPGDGVSASPKQDPLTVYVNGLEQLVDQGEVVEIDPEMADAMALVVEDAITVEDAMESRFDALDMPNADDDQDQGEIW